ncbi:MAG: DUF4142 domain-containing protein [Pseudomonadota bacterium]|nr:DUF4142 domain-containing protein [Pseudomonadota bacterium]
MKTNLAIFGSLAALAMAIPAGATLPTPSDAAATQNAQAFLFKAGAGDIFEIVTSSMAVQKSTNPAVRAFAAMIIADHTNATNTALATAAAAGVMAPPPELSPMQKDMIGQLMAAAPATFDRVYLSQQVPAHQQALALLQGYAARGDVPALRTAATQTVPVVAGHLSQAQGLLAAAR